MGEKKKKKRDFSRDEIDKFSKLRKIIENEIKITWNGE